MCRNIKVILIAFAVLVLCIVGYGCNAPAKGSRIKSGKEITFFVATDIHYLAKSLTDDGQAFKKYTESGDGKQLGYIYEIMDAFASDIESKKPDVLILSGDLTNNGEKESHMELAKRLENIKKAGTNVYVIPGNHDILNPYARGFKGDSQYKADSISDKDFSKIYGDFGYNDAASRDKSTLSYLAAPSEDVWLLMLDTAQYENNIKNGQPQLDGRISDGTFKWIQECKSLADKKGARIVTVMHHNLLDHSSVMSKGFTINDKDRVLDKFRNLGLDLALSGHIHFQNIRWADNKKDNSRTYDITTGALSVYPQQYGILKYSPSKGYDYSTSQIDVDGWAKKTGNKDVNLNNFKEYSRNEFSKRIYYRACTELFASDAYTDEQVVLMAGIARDLNLKHFDGTFNTGMDDIRNSEGFKLLKDAPDCFTRNLVMKLINDGDIDNNNLHISISKGGK